MSNGQSSIKIKDHAAVIEAKAQLIINRCKKLREEAGKDCHALRIISPTGKGIRKQDKWGSGVYGASRDGGKRKHLGDDWEGDPGQDVKCPIFGAMIVREARPYANQPYSGLRIENAYMEMNLFYFDPDKSLIGKHVHLGDVIGKMQDVSEKYPGMIPHVHMQILSIATSLLVE